MSSPHSKIYRHFVEAAERRDRETILKIIREHPEIHNLEGVDGDLVSIIGHNCPELFSAAFKAGLHPDSGSENPLQTPLQVVIANDDLKTVRLFLEYGADVERRNVNGETSLGFAAAWASLEMVKLLVDAGAQVNAIEHGPEGFYDTALNAAIGRDPADGRQPIADFLRSKGAKTYNELIAEGNFEGEAK